MSSKLDKILTFVDGINDVVGKIVSLLMVVLTLVVMIEVFMRYVLNSPTTWTFETTTMLYGSYFMLSAGYALLHKAHVGVDFFYEKRSKRAKAWLDVISYTTLFFPFVTVLLIEGTKFAAESWAIREHSWSVFGPPVYPYKTVIPVMAALLLLQGAAIYVRNLRIIFRKQPVTEPKNILCDVNALERR